MRPLRRASFYLLLSSCTATRPGAPASSTACALATRKTAGYTRRSTRATASFPTRNCIADWIAIMAKTGTLSASVSAASRLPRTSSNSSNANPSRKRRCGTAQSARRPAGLWRGRQWRRRRLERSSIVVIQYSNAGKQRRPGGDVGKEERQLMICQLRFTLAPPPGAGEKPSSRDGSPTVDFPPGGLLLAVGRWA
jgi:hypothetical protein